MADGEWGGALQVHPLQIKISWLVGTNVQQTGFYLRAAAANIADAEEAATEVAQWVTDHFRNLLRVEHRVLSIDATDLVRREGFTISPASQMGTAGGDASLTLPGFVAAVVSLKSAKRTRYGQGRMFLPVVNEGMVYGDVIAPTSVPAFQGTIDELVDAFTGNTLTGYNLINVHGVLPPRPATGSRPARPEIPPSWYDVQSVRLNLPVTSLRSRKAGVGS